MQAAGWRAGFDWLRDNPEHPHHDEVKKRVIEGRSSHLNFFRQYNGWAMLVGRKVS